MHWMSRKGRALAGGMLLAVAVSPAFAAPQDAKLAPGVTPPAAAPATPPADGSEARRMTAAEVRQAVAKGEAVLVDVRAKDSYDFSHAQGALSIPLAQITDRAGELPKDKLVVTYCTCGAEQTSSRAAAMLQKKGFTQVACLLGGLGAWTEAGGSTVDAPKPK
jgi:rhodanese-related sulfurtransferase